MQSAVKEIQQLADAIQKEAYAFAQHQKVQANQKPEERRSKVEERHRRAKIAEDEAKEMLSQLVSKGGTANEQNMLRLMQQKLGENLAAALKSVEVAVSAFRKAESDRSSAASTFSMHGAKPRQSFGLELEPLATDARC